VMYNDFEKTFDKVPHKRLISKVRSYGFGDVIIMWIQHYSRRSVIASVTPLIYQVIT